MSQIKADAIKIEKKNVGQFETPLKPIRIKIENKFIVWSICDPHSKENQSIIKL